MKRLGPSLLFDFASFLELFEAESRSPDFSTVPLIGKRLTEDELIPSVWQKDLGEMLSIIEKHCLEIGLTASLSSIRRMKAIVQKEGVKRRDLSPPAVELRGRISDELKERFFLSLSAAEAQYYSKPRAGWSHVIRRFPETVTDIEEAAKCFALSRYAATVFHTLQIVEIGLIELGKLIVVSDPLLGWNATTIRLSRILSTKYPDRTAFQQNHSAFLEQINATIEVMKSAWRNKVSHAQGKLVLLTSDFTPEVAEEILFASRGFMRRLATEAPTSPDPDA